MAVVPRETPAYGGGAGRLHNGTGAVSFFAAYGPLQKATAYGGGRLLFFLRIAVHLLPFGQRAN